MEIFEQHTIAVDVRGEKTDKLGRLTVRNILRNETGLVNFLKFHQYLVNR